MNAFDTIMARREDSKSPRTGQGLSIMPALRTLIIGCADPRVDPVFVLELKPGDAAVLRNVGGRITPGAEQELALLQEVARAHGARPGTRFDLIVLHHTDCGIPALEHRPEQLARHLGVGETDLPGKAVGDPRSAVAVDVALLRSDPCLPPDWVVSGLVYDVCTDHVEVVVPPDTHAP